VRRGEAGDELSTVKPRARAVRDPAPDVAVLCRSCGHEVTRRAARTRAHRFMNPAVYLFHLGCFARADGCAVEGPSSLEYPWFEGHAWRFALCGGCGAHLGWRFEPPTGAAPFFGLRLDQIAEAEPGAPLP
jgi:hypothetical protein